MKITRVTITGADDLVSHHELADLAQEFQWLELGVLYSLERAASPRYPSDGWRQQLFHCVEPRQIALHFCGEAALGAMAGIVQDLPFVPVGCRIQLNGFSKWRLPALLIAHAREDLQVILQCDGTAAATGNALRLRSVHENVSALIDASGGAGRFQPDTWIQPPGLLRCGYAGGINEFNVESALQIVRDLPGQDGWIDLETGCRDHENRFDLAKARRILELAKPFVEAL